MLLSVFQSFFKIQVRFLNVFSLTLSVEFKRSQPFADCLRSVSPTLVGYIFVFCLLLNSFSIMQFIDFVGINYAILIIHFHELID